MEPLLQLACTSTENVKVSSLGLAVSDQDVMPSWSPEDTEGRPSHPCNTVTEATIILKYAVMS